MISVHAAIRQHLATNMALHPLVGSRIWAGRIEPAPGYQPSQGAAITFAVRGGAPDYSDAIVEPSVQFQCWGATEVQAETAYNTLFDAMQNAHNGVIAWARCEVLGQLLREPATGWPFVLTYFQVKLRNGG